MLRRLLVSATMAVLPALPQESTASIANPFDTPFDRAAGGRIFKSQCASCHGQDGRGGQGTPDLTTGSFKRATSDEGLVQVIVRGIPGTTMPAFSLTGRENWQLLAFIRSLTVARSNANAKGDAAKGALLFRSNGCANCHGTAKAPDLEEAARRMTLAELRRAILDPQATVSPVWWRLRGSAKDGRPIAGLRLNEDTYSIQYLDESGRLRSEAKSDLSRWEIIRESPMPSFQAKLSGEQLDDLLAFLVKGAGQ